MERLSTKIKLNGIDFTVLYKSELYDGSQKDALYMHEHYLLEMHLILRGRGLLHTKEGVFPLGKGTCVLIGKNTSHRLVSRDENPLIRFEMLIDYENPAGAKDGFLRFLDQTTIHIWRRSKNLTPFANALATELLEQQTGYQQGVKAYLALILTRIMRMSDVLPEEFPPVEEPGDEMKVKAFTVIDTFFGQNYNRNANAEELADILCVSKRQLYRIMQKYSDMSFKQQLIQVRLEVAKRLLEETDLSVGEIAEKSGYEYASSFCKAFKNKAGLSPEDYRHITRKDERKNDK